MPRALDRGGRHHGVHADACARVVVQVDEADRTRLGERRRDLDQPAEVRPERRVELCRDDPFLLAQRALEPCLALLDAE